jgi:D-alanine transaminase
LANQKAASLGCYEAVFHRGERVTEGTHSNIHIIKEGKFQTAPLDNLILPGITRLQLIRLCQKLNIPVVEKAFSVKEMFEADEIITSSSTAFALSASHIDDKLVGAKAPEILKALQDGIEAEFNIAIDKAGK